MTYKHLRIEERAVIAFLIRNGESVRSAAEAVGRNPSTTSREIRRNPPTKGPAVSNITRGRPGRWPR